MIKLKSKNHFERYIEICNLYKNAGIENYEDSSSALVQYLHLIQGMQVAQNAHDMYVRDMNEWLKNVEWYALEDFEKAVEKKKNKVESRLVKRLREHIESQTV